jgi:hypothetical protein
MSEEATHKSSSQETTESTTIATPFTLLEELGERSGLSWRQAAVVVGLVLALFAVVAAYLDGLLTGAFDADLWRGGMSAPVIIAYLLLIQPTLRRLRDGAIEAFRPLVPLGEDDFRGLLGEASMFNRRREWLAVGIAILGGLLLSRHWEGLSLWLTLYGLLGGTLLYGILGFFIYSSLSGTRLFAKLHRHAVDINVFDLGRLEPIGRWSLGIALAYIGGNTLSLLFLTRAALRIEMVIFYIPLILAPILVFFLNMMSTHRVIAEAKGRELKTVRNSLAAASQRLREQAAKGRAEDMEAQLDSITAWVTYEKRVREVPEWPYSESMMRNLAASILLPIMVLVVQGVLFELLLRFLSSAR